MWSIETWWTTLSFWEHTFWGIAVVCSVLSIIQLILSFLGLQLENTPILEKEEERFHLFSARNTIFFLAFFGWTNVLVHPFDLLWVWQVLIAAAVGLVAMFLLGYLAFNLRNWTIATQFDPNELLFKTAVVQQTVPPQQSGQGRVRYTKGKREAQLTAVSDHLVALPNGSSVRIVEVIENDLVLVEPR